MDAGGGRRCPDLNLGSVLAVPRSPFVRDVAAAQAGVRGADDCIQNAWRAMRVDPDEVRGALGAVWGWLDGEAPEPGRAELARAVRLSLRTLAQVAPGATVEVRVPPFAAVQCVAGPRHTRGTPPNLVETDPRTWLELATGRLSWPAALSEGRLTASGPRADLSPWLPLPPHPAGLSGVNEVPITPLSPLNAG